MKLYVTDPNGVTIFDDDDDDDANSINNDDDDTLRNRSLYYML